MNKTKPNKIVKNSYEVNYVQTKFPKAFDGLSDAHTKSCDVNDIQTVCSVLVAMKDQYTV